MTSVTRLAAAAAVASLVAVACGSAAGDDGEPQGAAGTADPGGTCGGGTELHAGEPDVEEAPVDEAAEFPWQRAEPVAAEGFDFDAIIPGGPPPDGIRPIDAPCFESVESASEWLEPQSPVLNIEVNGEQRAYPLSIMTQHEIANDVIGGEPVVVTYCPLCNSGLAFFRTVDGQVLDFGTSGRLFQSNLVMYDRQNKSLWVQLTGRAVVGEPWVGTQLERITTGLVAFEEFARAAPDGAVLARETSPDRDYGRNPYPGYEERGSSFLFQGPTDDRLPPNSRVVGLAGEDGADPQAIPLDLLREKRVVEIDLDGEPVVVWWAPGASSALDAQTVDEGRDVGQTGSFRPVAPDGTELTFQPTGEDEATFVDDQTGSTWNILGEAESGPLEGEKLESIPRDDTFWFVWFSFRPETTVVTDGGSGGGS